jgi:glycosyltransferase involved in cell wall biosynthesis
MHLVRENEVEKRLALTVFSAWDDHAVAVASDFEHTKFVFVRSPWFIKWADRAIYVLAKHLLRVKKLMSYRFIVQRLWYIRRVSRTLAGRNFDRVLIENHPTLFAAFRRGKNANRYAGKVYFHLHNEVSNTFGNTEQIRSVRRILGVSGYINRSVEMSVGGLKPEQMRVLQNCVDTVRFGSSSEDVRAEELRRTLGIGSGELVFLFSGRLTAEKGAENLLNAFATAAIPNACLVIAGSYFFDSGIQSDFEGKLKQIAERSRLRIVFTGHIEYEAMPSVYAMADVCCLPSVWNDPAPLAVIEAMAAGRPLITTRSGGIPEYIDAECAIVLEPDESLTERLATAMVELAEDAKRRRLMGIAAKTRASQFGVERFYSEFVSLLD